MTQGPSRRPDADAIRAYQGRPAGAVTRVAAAAIDLVVTIGIVVLIEGAFVGVRFVLDPRSFHWPDTLGKSSPVIGALVLIPYLTSAWVVTGRTYGGALFGLRVLDARGSMLRAPRAFLRAVACTAFPVGLFWVAVSRTNRSVQDIVLHTIVIYDWCRRPDLNP